LDRVPTRSKLQPLGHGTYTGVALNMNQTTSIDIVILGLSVTSASGNCRAAAYQALREKATVAIAYATADA
jgi:hypothetical protein